MYICPKCRKELVLNASSYRCENNHCYDVSSKGYVNLLLTSGAKQHGDNKLMLDSRRHFLSLGHYCFIIEKLFELICVQCSKKESLRILDAGCGEGYYTGALFDKLSDRFKNIEIYGIDVSKHGVAMAAKKYKKCDFSVASINALPFISGYFDVVLSLFAPISEAEFERVLKDDGVLITVSPSPKHLLGLKTAIYKNTYENEETTFAPELFKKTGESMASDTMSLFSAEDISSLFAMTPYYYKTDEEGKKRVGKLTSLTTEIGAMFYCFEKRVL